MFIKLRKFLIIDVVHTDDTENTDGGPQADSLGERESSEFKRKLNGGSLADGGDGRVNGRVERGSFTLTLSQNRA